MRLDFDKISMKRSKNRKHFHSYLLEGANLEIDELIEYYKVVNIKGFKDFIKKFAQKYVNVAFNDNLLHMDAIADQHLAFDQSMDFISYFYTTDKDEEEKDKKEDSDPTEQNDI